jgi:hypothetical protein
MSAAVVGAGKSHDTSLADSGALATAGGVPVVALDAAEPFVVNFVWHPTANKKSPSAVNLNTGRTRNVEAVIILSWRKIAIY